MVQVSIKISLRPVRCNCTWFYLHNIHILILFDPYVLISFRSAAVVHTLWSWWWWWYSSGRWLHVNNNDNNDFFHFSTLDLAMYQSRKGWIVLLWYVAWYSAMSHQQIHYDRYWWSNTYGGLVMTKSSSCLSFVFFALILLLKKWFLKIGFRQVRMVCCSDGKLHLIEWVSCGVVPCAVFFF